jgi:hypothetical protein
MNYYFLYLYDAYLYDIKGYAGGWITPDGFMEYMDPAERKQFYSRYHDFTLDKHKKFIYTDSKDKVPVKFRNHPEAGLIRPEHISILKNLSKDYYRKSN